MVLFITSVVFFSLVLKTPNTNQVLLYFIPDISLVLGNIIMTFILKDERLKAFLSSKVIKFLIALGYYINIFSAVFYAFMFMDETWFKSGLFDRFAQLWL